MRVGKREQIVISGIITIVVIGLMHFLIFSPAVRNFRDAKSKYEELSGKISTLQTIQNKDMLTSFSRQTEQYIAELTTGTKILQLEEPEAFIPPDPAKLNVTIPPGTPPDVEKQIRDSAFLKKLLASFDEETTMMLQQVSFLQDHAREKLPVMTFLGPQGWNIPTALPPAMQTGQLWDVIRVVEEYKGALKTLGKETAAYQSFLNQYNNLLLTLGLNVQTSDKLRQYGEFVPVIYRLAFVQLIMKQMPADRPIIIHEKELDLKRLLEMLEVNVPYDPINGIPENKLYFAFEELRQLNKLLTLSGEFQINEITEVTFYPYGYLRQQDVLKMATKDVPTDPAALPNDQVWFGGTQVTPSGGMTGEQQYDENGNLIEQQPEGVDNGAAGMKGGASHMANTGGVGNGTVAVGTSDTNPRPDEIGLALPIRVTFRSENMRAWTFMYEVLRRQPLVEMNRIKLTSLSQIDPNNQNIEASVTYIMVPKLFKTMDEVRKVLEEIHSTQAAPTPGAAAAQ